MNKLNIRVYDHLTSKERRDFFILHIGLHYFVKNKRLIKHDKMSFARHFSAEEKIINSRLSFRLEPVDDKYIFIAYDGTKDVIFLKERNSDINKVDPRMFVSALSEEIIGLLLDAVQNNVPRESKPKEIMELHNLKPNNLFYRFILGAGVSNKRDYNGIEWNDFKNDFEKAIDDTFGEPGLAKSMAGSVFNANYGAFQVVKDIENNLYKQLLYQMISSLKTPDVFDDTTLSAVVDVVDRQSENGIQQRVVTFNYDDLFEELYSSKYGGIYSVCHKRNNFEPSAGSPLVIYHPHGFVDKYEILRNPMLFESLYLKSIVLTTDEYIDAYASPTSPAYKILFDQLNQTCCFIGNSITDYEEQKVIKKHFDKNPSSFHFAYLQTNNLSDHRTLYKTIFLLKIGIIPLWYLSHDEYRDELKHI